MASLRETVVTAQRDARLLPGDEERFSGWGVMGLPFRSGDVFASRSFSASSVGPGYNSAWYRDPQGPGASSPIPTRNSPVRASSEASPAVP